MAPTLDPSWLFYQVAAQQPAPPVWTPAPREYAGNMCGIRIAGLPRVAGCAADPETFLSWLFDRYPADWQARILDEYRRRGFTDFAVSWPDSRAIGQTPAQFAATCERLVQAGFYVTVFFGSKDYDPWYAPTELKRRISEVLPLLTRKFHRAVHAWECSIWMTSYQVQEMIDWLAPQVLPWGCQHFAHFQQGWTHFDNDGPDATFARFWNRNMGRLHGILHQRVQDPPSAAWDAPEYQARLVDILDRFAGGYFCSPVNGINGEPFSCVAWEINAMPRFAGSDSEASNDFWSRVAVDAQPVNGPLGPVRVDGSGNGRA